MIFPDRVLGSAATKVKCDFAAIRLQGALPE
jgi:hypothetical protein